ncbi:hypothetical protein HPB51_023083 [Rhipicephalus microplus]|uniref:Uncharacterized protein n=1 Tax=Rhipicephalus microplus TaxID=6941 RepID=A0A9J6EC74_RHIMP|nr:hypothetical protein HPB51_023083 [Rhipicephalus microplus]
MSSGDKQADVATQQADEVISAKEKGAGDAKTEKSPQKRTSAEVSEDDDVKKKVQKVRQVPFLYLQSFAAPV